LLFGQLWITNYFFVVNGIINGANKASPSLIASIAYTSLPVATRRRSGKRPLRLYLLHITGSGLDTIIRSNDSTFVFQNGGKFTAGTTLYSLGWNFRNPDKYIVNPQSKTNKREVI
jgi:hypothetical protein